jgi:Na+-transporting methylmalonyl-CoA/oxaloacetate decarboxylase gamma subunit
MIDNLIMNNLIDGLKITGLGMGIVFAILIVLYISIKILGRFAK